MAFNPTTGLDQPLTLIDQLTVDLYKLLLRRRAKLLGRYREDQYGARIGGDVRVELGDLARLARQAAQALVTEMER